MKEYLYVIRESDIMRNKERFVFSKSKVLDYYTRKDYKTCMKVVNLFSFIFYSQFFAYHASRLMGSRGWRLWASGGVGG